MSLVLQDYLEDKHISGPKVDVPERCSQRAILKTGYERRHIVVTLVIPSEIARRITKGQRQKDLEELTQMIRLGELSLLRDTVTEILITDPNEQIDKDNILSGPYKCPWNNTDIFSRDNQLASIADDLVIQIREDPDRIRYPLLGSVSTKVVSPEKVEFVNEITVFVSRVKVTTLGLDSGESLVYKKVRHLLPCPEDSAAMTHEIEVLEQCRAIPGIVNMRAIVAGASPYMTGYQKKTGDNVYVQGILLDDHGDDTLAAALGNARFSSQWRRWIPGLVEALSELHALGFCHLDLHGYNVVIGQHGDKVILIDISCGYGGWYPGGTPPEIRDWIKNHDLSLKDQPLEVRQSSDTWALGNLLRGFLRFKMSEQERIHLQDIVEGATLEEPTRRISLSTIKCRIREMTNLRQS